MGAGVGVDVGVIVEVRVMDALNVVGRTVVMGTFRPPDRLALVVVKELVVRATVTLTEIDAEGDDEPLEDWADTESRR